MLSRSREWTKHTSSMKQSLRIGVPTQISGEMILLSYCFDIFAKRVFIAILYLVISFSA